MSNIRADDPIAPSALRGRTNTAQPELYRIQPGDILDIKFFYNPELNEEGIPVRPDGKIVIQMGREIQAAGLTSEQIRKSLIESFSNTLKDPEVAVLVKGFGNEVFVDGAVNHPGSLAILGPITALQAISRAGGVTQSAQIGQVLVLRKGPEGAPLVMELNLEKALTGRDLAQDILLEPKDIIYVPLLAIANVNKWVDSYIRKNIPVRLGFTTFDF